MTKKWNSNRNNANKFTVTANNDSVVTLQDINGNELVRNITFVKYVNIADQKEDKDISIQEEKET